MTTYCLLCDRPIKSIAAIVNIGNVEEPESAAICYWCATASPQEDRRLRDAAMARMLQQQRGL
jgi:hypothetical protein